MHLIARSIQLLLLVTTASRAQDPGEKANSQCEEYAKLVYADEQNPTLHVNSRTDEVSKCDIVAVPLIIGGMKASEHEFPHMAVIGYGQAPTDPDLAWHCGGSLISADFVLTAAHCVKDREKGESQRVRVGTNNVLQPDASMQEADIAERIPHPEYKARPKYNDIALLRLATAIALDAHIRPACLCTDAALPWTFALATGFGRLEYDQATTSAELMKVQLSNVDKTICDETYRSMKSMHDGVIESQFCAGELAGKKDTCQGDSGGPLQIVLDKPYCMYKLVGVTSFGKFCGFENSPGIYTRVASFVGWIESIVWP